MTGVRGAGGVPAQACVITDGAPLWQWSEVAHWLWQNDMIKEEVFAKPRKRPSSIAYLSWSINAGRSRD